MEKSSVRASTGSPQRARLEILRGLLGASDSTSWMLLDETATLSVRGAGRGTEVGPAEELAWELAMTAQSCALLAIELQARAEHFASLEQASLDWTYRRPSVSTGIFRGLLTNMLRKFRHTNEQGASTETCVISEGLEQAILSMWAADNLTITDGCTTRAESQGTSDTGNAGDMR
jgi:hypothetical protein